MPTAVRVLQLEIGTFAEEVRRAFRELGRSYGPESIAGECAPPLDLYETEVSIEVRVDLPGVDTAAVRVMVKGNGLLVAGDKSPRRGRADSSFHLAERGFGRFARTLHLPIPCDALHARATLVDGELRISLPKIAERRGAVIDIQVEP